MNNDQNGNAGQLPDFPEQYVPTGSPETRQEPPPPETAPGLVPGGIAVRAGALLLDSALVGLPCAFLLAGVPFGDPLMGLISALYQGAMVALYGQTLGKMAAGIHVINEDGSRPAFMQACIRGVVSVFSSLILGIGYLVAAFNPQRRALGDFAAGTRVVYLTPVGRLRKVAVILMPLWLLLAGIVVSVGVYFTPPLRLASYERMCAKGTARYCYEAGKMYLEGEGTEKDFSKSLELYRKACDGGVQAVCDHLNKLKGAAENAGAPAEAGGDYVAGFQRDCAAGKAEACGKLGMVYYNGGAVIKDPARAAVYLRQACEGGDAGGCFNLGWLSSKGEGVVQDFKAAAGYYDKACRQGFASACTNLSISYSEGRGVPKDAAMARTLALRACALGEERVCSKLGLSREAASAAGGAAAAAPAAGAAAGGAGALREACEDGDGKACLKLGYMSEKGSGVPRDAVRAADLYEQGCDAGNAAACGALGFIYVQGKGREQSLPEAGRFCKKGCDGGDAWSCYYLGRLYASGKPPDLRRAAELYKKACAMGYKEGCSQTR